MRLILFFLCCLLILIFNLEALVVEDLLYFGKFQPGETAKVKVSLTNEQPKAELVEFKLSDYACNCEGQHFYDPPGTRVKSNAAWITLNTYREVIEPGEKADIYFTIKIPNDPLLQGSYWSVLLIEPANIWQTIKTTEGLQVQIKVRYAYHIVTHIGQGVAKLKILKKELRTINNQEMLCIDILNTGDLFLKPKLTLKVFNNQGKLEKTLEEQNEKLYPDNSQRYFLNVDGLNRKKFKAFLMLDNGDQHLFGDSFDLELQ